MNNELPYGFIKIIDDTGELLREVQTHSDSPIYSKWENKYANGILEFSEKELSKMPKEFKKEFRAGKITAHVRRKKNGVFEIRCQINKTPIRAASKVLATAKEKFIVELYKIINNNQKVPSNAHILLCPYMLEWLETIKKPLVKPITYKDYLYNYNAYIKPTFNDRELSEIKGFELQKFLNGFTEKEKFRTANKLYQLLSAVFEYAVVDDIITKSPMQKVSIQRYEQEHGIPLTREEEKYLLNCLINSGSVYAQAYVFLIYTGLRRSELSSVVLSDNWITLTTSKQRKGYKKKLRSIPIPSMLARVLPIINLEAIKALHPAMLTKHIKDYFPNHHAHDLRHTFITRAQECGIQRELVSLWAGHTADSSTTTLIYTHLEQNKEHQIEAMKKFDYIL